ncbi:hypothetical protein DRE_07486 [Drechslerella stenobrocha 248]|uniref:Mitochondrial carrier n=1 Tax=Drechslerella stenobrocha 248 TaxID=1043628 RepID=W7HKJ2_9PEZI|nr:hypothetical protein DRE_07486 [Drechslerella stenobrocha 248]
MAGNRPHIDEQSMLFRHPLGAHEQQNHHRHLPNRGPEAPSHNITDDPTDFEGQAVIWDGDAHEEPKKKSKSSNAVQGASAAGTRAVTMQLVTFYFRYPVKAFMRLRIDYLAVARAINPQVQANEPWSLRQSSFGILAHAVKVYGWRFIPNQVLPPLLANTSMGVLLYTSYLQILQHNHEPAGHATKRAYPPPPYWATFAAGAGAGALQSLFAAPLDAISVRFDVNELVKDGHMSFWAYGRKKLTEMGLRGVFAGYGLNLAKEALGYAFFFSSFEYIKQQAYYGWLSHYYGHQHRYLHPFGTKASDPITIIKPHWTLEPMFILLAGAGASFTSQAIFHPFNQVQNVHLRQLEFMDRTTATARNNHPYKWWARYSDAYRQTYLDCKSLANTNNGWRKWLYQGYLLNTVKSTPGTAAVLIVFELVRRRFGEDVGAASIQHDGFKIVL